MEFEFAIFGFADPNLLLSLSSKNKHPCIGHLKRISKSRIRPQPKNICYLHCLGHSSRHRLLQQIRNGQCASLLHSSLKMGQQSSLRFFIRLQICSRHVLHNRNDDYCSVGPKIQQLL